MVICLHEGTGPTGSELGQKRAKGAWGTDTEETIQEKKRNREKQGRLCFKHENTGVILFLKLLSGKVLGQQGSRIDIQEPVAAWVCLQDGSGAQVAYRAGQ